ncbi:MAG: hypothetical protein V3W20_10570 [Candidatus Neomarinimicrobiota bacterium]
MSILSKQVVWCGSNLWVEYEHQEEELGGNHSVPVPEDCTIQEVTSSGNIYDVIEKAFNLGREAGKKEMKNELYRPNAFEELEEIVLKK